MGPSSFLHSGGRGSVPAGVVMCLGAQGYTSSGRDGPPTYRHAMDRIDVPSCTRIHDGMQ